MDLQKRVKTFYALLEQKDLTNWKKLWTNNATNSFPYANDLIEKELIGIQSIIDFWSGSPDLYARLKFDVLECFEKENCVVVFFTSKNLLKDEDTFYEDKQIGVFEFDQDGLILSYEEYFDPLNLGQTFEMIQVTQIDEAV